jgi:hypothetical protein
MDGIVEKQTYPSSTHSLQEEAAYIHDPETNKNELNRALLITVDHTTLYHCWKRTSMEGSDDRD